MAICITFGTHEFTSRLQGYENITAQCQNCGNWSAQCITRWPWFTVCFVPVIPLAFHKYKEVYCHICRFTQDIKYRPDVQSQHMQGGQGPPPVASGANAGPGQFPPGGYYGYK
ncbi:rhodopsin family protein [Coccidioides immitis RS]|uniref:Rhodopsin family protein n=6 Tax=Coccidioides TaxID=5500 RepID=A0A0D8JXQ2_COCIM|nr:rhodopsin family protein [Coccidioides immitis RS]EFW15461.1 hypothetical protein CPSG_07898 [Coccidioides posadasii str. Silveira]KMM70424.1 hypothetical protein CPAG_06736 [Coccidioides posadasii RMSCC 3488]KMP05089.1 hypothetical protein CIRG_04770 [Coccidioides immitis RMSCC 2394]KMU77617.1 hypothetical protein CISG_01374 [Coccidioides immitis RMSCC 3703]KMU85542.1 hypothetical protein CIHG_03582 [Coccidioides immitis H538.4]TPX21497.1 hypothetical protein DIZ76_015455 [Coccidioides im